MIGRTISHYRVLEKLGGGGMGVVYKGEDTRLGRPVALKFLPTDLTGDALAKARFVQEARAASALDHPNICTVYDIGETDDGQLFIAMAYYAGETLKARLAQGPLPVEEAIDLAIQIAQGLGRAHAHGIVHRDVKPANVIVTGDGVAKVVDFGIAKLPDVTALTLPGSTWGTVSYMAPEQMRGGAVDHRADIWALGVLVYEAIAGRVPFGGDRAEAAMYSVLNATPEPLHQIRAGVPIDLAQVVGRALAKDPGQRYQTIGELAAALKRIQRGLQSSAPAAADRHAPSIAVLPFSDMSPGRDQDYFCEGIAEELLTALARLDGVRVAARTSSFQFKGQAVDVREIGTRLNVETVLEGSVRKAGNRVRITAELVNASDGYHLWSERYDRDMDDVFAIQDEIARAIIDQLKIKLTGTAAGPLIKHQTDDLEAYNLYLQGRYYWSRRYPGFLQKAIRSFEQAIELDPGYAVAHAGLADGYNILGFYGLLPPAEAFAKARDAADRALALADDLAEAHQARGFVYWIFEWEYQSAEREYRRAFELNPKWAFAHTQWAWWLAWLGRFDEAIEEAHLARDLEPAAPLVGMYVAATLFDARKYEDALAECHRVIELDPSFVVPLWLEAWVLSAVKRHDEAVRSAEKAVDLARRQSFYLGVLAHAYARAGRPAEAQGIWDELAERAGREYVSPLYFAQIAAALGQIDTAFEWLERAVDTRAPLVPRLPVDLLFDGLRSDPRFAVVLERIGLPHVRPANTENS